MFDVVTFGSAVADTFVDTNLAEKRGHIAYPVGAKLLIKDLKFDIGGGGTNTAVAFSRLGLKTGCVCKIGDSKAGQDILQLLKKEKIDFLGKQQKNTLSGQSIILDSKENNRTILTYKGVNNNISFNEIKKFQTKWLYFSSLLGKSFESQIKLAKTLTKKGAKLAFNPSSYLIKRKNLKPLLKICHILVLNKEEAQMLTKDKDQLIGLKKLGPKIVVITDKNKEIQCYNSEEDKTYTLKPNKIKVVERTGAGDAFASGFVAGIIVGKSIPQSLRLGLRESESVIRHFGAKNKLLRLKLK
ncbi:carbohydrate kinase family protein [Candidatus Pacearchaeota archaeon]|nr:carbohydrate kinase family protein [Candidatus Pacearchaeota archaeon]|tara:strand:+ start:10123 stop:11019 length:897 start_codon:yes stop_codon:yes gene_type:complete